jgi:hypothetical protein
MESNPYQAPSARVEDPVETGVDAERTAHLRHEARLRMVGILYWLGAAVMVVIFGSVLVVESVTPDAAGWAMPGTLTVIALLAAVVGWGYWSLSPWVRWPGTVFSVLGLLAIPIGPIVHGYFLYLMWCAKGRRVLAPDYAEVRRRTPHLRYRRTVGDWIALAILIGLPVLFGLFVWVGTMLPKDY